MSSEPVEFYPTPITTQPNPSHSNGSFGPVFVVLAVIIVVSAVACVLGRLCGRRRRHHPKHQASHNTKAQKPSHALGPKEWEPKQKQGFSVRDHGDIEFGFDNKIPSGKMAAKGGGGGGGGGGKGKPPYNGGGHRPEFRFSDNIV